MTSKRSEDGSLYYIPFLDTVYIQVSDKKGIRSLFDPETGHRLSLELGTWVCNWSDGLPTKEDLSLQAMITPSLDLMKYESRVENFREFMGRYAEWKNQRKVTG